MNKQEDSQQQDSPIMHVRTGLPSKIIIHDNKEDVVPNTQVR
jgi:hypothetical protein